MLRLNPRHRLKVPHGLAVIGALLLLASTPAVVGITLYQSNPQEPTASISLSSSEEHSASLPAAETTDGLPQPPVTQKKRFRINLFLFRR